MFSASKLQSAFYESLPVILPVLNLKFHLSSRQFYTAVICPVRRVTYLFDGAPAADDGHFPNLIQFVRRRRRCFCNFWRVVTFMATTAIFVVPPSLNSVFVVSLPKLYL